MCVCVRVCVCVCVCVVVGGRGGYVIGARFCGTVALPRLVIKVPAPAPLRMMPRATVA